MGHKVKNKNKKKEGEKGVGNEMLQRKSQKMEGNLEFFNRESSLIPTENVAINQKNAAKTELIATFSKTLLLF